MGKSERGPGMQNCLSYLAQMDSDQQLYTTVLLLPGGSVNAPSVTINLLSVSNGVSLEGSAAVSTSYGPYPSRDHATFEGALYRAIIEHDKVISARELQLILKMEG